MSGRAGSGRPGSGRRPRPLSLPEEFVLLSHMPSGKVHGSARAVIGCAAAELGELALRRRLLLRVRKWRGLGVDIYQTHGVEIELLDTGPTGLGWADGVLSELRRSASGNGRVKAVRWFRHRHEAFSQHREALVARGVLTPESGGFPGFSRTGRGHYPNAGLRNALIAEIRAAGGEQGRIDEHLLFLRDLTETVQLSRALGIPMAMRERMDRARGAGALESVPEELRDTSSALAGLVPSRDNDVRYGRRLRV